MDDRHGLRRQPFFRLRLLGLPADDIAVFLQTYVEDARALEEQLIQISFYMRGMPLNDAYRMSPSQRKKALKLIEENIDRTNKTGVMMH